MRRKLPDAAAVYRRHGLAFSAAEGSGKLRHVPHYAVGTEFIRRMRIRLDKHPDESRPFIRTPVLSESDKELLLRCKLAHLF
jgi:hypothetical protein